jgi:hypothetical protein
MTRPPFIGVKIMLDPETKKIKNGLEKRLDVIRKRKKKQEMEMYAILCQIFRLKNRCFSCEKNAALPPGECRGLTPECLKWGVK